MFCLGVPGAGRFRVFGSELLNCVFMQFTSLFWLEIVRFVSRRFGAEPYLVQIGTNRRKVTKMKEKSWNSV